MSIYNNKLVEYWKWLFYDLADPRTNDWPLIGSPIPGLTIIGLYLYFVNTWGPRFMANRKPFKLEKTLIIYNFIQVLLSTYIVVEGLSGAWLFHYSWRCEPVDFSTSPHALRVARGVYIYFIAKLSELLDTCFFVVRKKDRQITFLHLYHHTVMPMISWGATKYYPGGHGTLIGVINSFVHIVMYTYYMLAAMGPKYQKYIWWKRHITDLQMIQFGIAFLHSAQLLYTDCGYPRWSVCFTLPNAIFFYMLFNDFYQRSYRNKQNKAAIDVVNKIDPNDCLPHELKLLENARLYLSKQNGYNQETNQISDAIIKHEDMNGNINPKSNGISNGNSNGISNGAPNCFSNGTTNGQLNGLTNGFQKKSD